MKKIGFIDYYIDEWHANNYPQWFREASRKDEFTIALAWEETTPEGLRPLKQWCEEMSISPAASIEQVVEECDAICVLAPSNPEVHEQLAELPLQSGKPVYIDKPFAPDGETAKRLFDQAAAANTPLMSSSALRFGKEIQQALNETFKNQEVNFVGARGSGSSFWEYSIHQLEMITMLLGTGAKRVMQTGNETADHLVIDYGDQRRAAMTLMPGQGFQISTNGEQDAVVIDNLTDFFPGLIEAMLEFFATGVSPINQEETIEIASLVATGIKALKQSGTWVELG